ncbi:site-specific integrase [Halanaerobium sp.]|jgi:integrase|uniref:site-specific integrase n=1 Tax=Halanaerobium sp. TaxID=1895664 RepID=UPI000DE72066|nr:site-specific integrase [Halanaerobium sp.]PUU86920.1 MAG: Site-specific recombinase XerD [Halanaerobium sp.]
MAHLRKRGRKKWQIVIELDRDPVTGERKRKYKTYNGTKREAENKMAELIQKYKDGNNADKYSEMKMKKLMRKYINNHQHNVATRTADRYRRIIKNHLEPAFGEMLIKKVKPMHIESYQTQKLNSGRINGGGLSSSTVRMHHNLLNSIFEYAQRLEIIERNPVSLISLPKKKKSKHKFLSREELNQILDYSEGLWIHDYILVAVSTGMRRGEMIGLEWENVDLKNKKISVVQALKRTSQGIELSEPKTKSSVRSISITDNTVAILRKIKSEQEKNKLNMGDNYNDRFDFVFCEKNGRYCNPNTVTRRFKRVVEAIGLEEIKLHDLRHTMASFLIKIANPKVVQERLGHSSISMTMDLYSHLSDDLQQKAADDLSEFINQNNTLKENNLVKMYY